MSRTISLTVGCLLVIGIGGCERGSIAWGPAEYSALTPSPPAPVESDAAALCATAEAAVGRYRYRAGWDVSGLIVSMSADDGAGWEPAVVADQRPIPVNACSHGPAISADSVNRYLHVAYFSDAAGGAGIYYVHSMNAERLAQHGEGMLEPPRAIVYGTRAARTSVASRGDTVLVAYEDPNSPRGRIQLAISVTGGHSFDQIVALPAGAADASYPRVELRGGEVAVSWRETVDGSSRAVRRVGRFR